MDISISPQTQGVLKALPYGDLKMLASVLSAFVENDETDCAELRVEREEAEPEEVSRARAWGDAVNAEILTRLEV